MKKTRKIIALVLALTFMFCFMAMSASAATTEIQPRSTCPNCGDGKYNASQKVQDEYTYTEYVGGCSYIAAAHYHKHEKVKVTGYCPACGYTLPSYTFWRTRCV